MKLLGFEIKRIKKPVPHAAGGLAKLFGDE